MLRVFTVVLSMLAYFLAGTAHCAIAEAICDESGVSVCTENAAQHTIPHGSDCQLEADLNAPPATDADFSANAKVLETAFPFLDYCLYCFYCMAATPPETTAAPASARDRLLTLARAWQFASRAAGFARAP
jgi:hypothetical protein